MQTKQQGPRLSTQQYDDLEKFCRGNPISAVLTPWQLEKLCRVFGVDPAEIEVSFNGWCKHVLLARDIAFVFPRNPGFIKAVSHELSFYEQFAHLDSLALPRLIRRMKDPDISYYEFGAITRLKGLPFCEFVRGISYDQMERTMTGVAELVATWHSIASDHLPRFLFAPVRSEPRRITVENWQDQVLRPARTEESVDFIYRFVRRLSGPSPLPRAMAQEAETKSKWTAALRELAELPHVLVHADIHEDHILVQPSDLSITGIIDWQTARVDNPVWDFNFGEWGGGICRWWDDLPGLLRVMWRSYLNARQIRLSTVEGLNLFYLLWDMIWMLYKRRNGERPIPTGKGYKESVGIYLDRLESATGTLPH